MTAMQHDAPAAGNVLGARLRSAREAAGLSVAQVAARLKMTSRMIESLECGDVLQGQPDVFVRGQLRSYARLLDVPLDDLPDVAGNRPVQPVELHPRTYTPPFQRIADKVMGRMVYIVITALIGVPVWMATRNHFSLPEPTASLDAPLAAESAVPIVSADGRDGASVQPRAVVASMASLPPPRRVAQETRPPALSLRFSDDSWVEFFAPDGSRIEQAMMRAGDRRDFEAGQVGRVVLGNAGTVEVLHRGHVQDLSAYRRADVARFTVSSDGSLAPLSH